MNKKISISILIIDYCDKKRITKLVDDYRVLYKN